MAKRARAIDGDVTATGAEQTGQGPLASVADFAREQRENAPEESAEDIARKALTGESSKENSAQQLPENPSPAATPAAEGIRDKSGELFNPELHAVNKEGAPSIAKSGLFRRKRGLGARVNIPTAVAVDPAEAQRRAAELAAQTEEAKQRKAIIAGTAIAEILFKSGYMLGGDEWNPIKNDARQIDERRDMVTAWTGYCYARGVEDIPPGLLVAFVVSAYALPRFAGTETQKRLSILGGTVKRLGLWFQNWRLKRASRATNRNDGERKDDTSKGDRAGTAS